MHTKEKFMLQRVQTIYILIYLTLSVALLTGLSVLEFVAESDYIEDKLILSVSTIEIDFSGKLFATSSELELIADEISKTPIALDKETRQVSYNNISPLLIIQIPLIILALWVLFGYKKLKRQLNFVRFLFLLTLLYVVCIMILSYFSLSYARPFMDDLPFDNISIIRVTPIGFYLVCALLPFSYLAQLGIKRDYNLIKSLDRLR